jgi:two-component system, NarL family, nitrate/nitrite response regulator NarL
MEEWRLEKKLKETLPQGAEIADVQELVRCLAQQVTHSAAAPVLYEPDGDIPEVILATEVDGVRYILIRSHPRPPHVQVILSPREEEIARMVAKGYPNKTIAAVLDISPWTVCTHLRRIFAKFGVGSRAAMVARLLEEGGHGARRLSEN